MGILVRGLIVRRLAMLLPMNSPLLEELGKRIRRRRNALGWTQEELADNAGIDRSYIGGVERGERNLTISVLGQICQALDCDIASVTKGIPGIAP